MAEIQKFKATVPEMLFGDTAYAVETGVESAQQYAFPASSHSNAVSQFQINVPNTSAVMDRRVLLEMPVQLTFACADVSPDTCLIDGRDAWRAYPLDAIMDNVKVTINGLGNRSRMPFCSHRKLFDRLVHQAKSNCFRSGKPSLRFHRSAD